MLRLLLLCHFASLIACSSSHGERDGGAGSAETYCVDRGGAECQRDFYAGRITIDGFNECVSEILPRCSGAGWGGCAVPRDRQITCLEALRDEARLGVVTEDIDECRIETLCP